MACDRSAQVHAFHDGELDAAAARAVEAHLAECPPCASLLDELRRLTRMIGGAPFSAMPERAVSRFYGSWDAARDRGALRTVSWLTAAAAAVLAVGIGMWPRHREAAPVARSNAWEIAALTPPAPAHAGAAAGEDGSDLVSVAQWIANDLSGGGER
jgi:anti-sigma factor RsiW